MNDRRPPAASCAPNSPGGRFLDGPSTENSSTLSAEGSDTPSGRYLNGSRGGSRLSSITSSCCSPAPLPPALPPPGFGGPALAVSGPSAEDVKDGGEAAAATSASGDAPLGASRCVSATLSPASLGGDAKRGSIWLAGLRVPLPDGTLLLCDAGLVAAAMAAASAASAAAPSIAMGSSATEMACSPSPNGKRSRTAVARRAEVGVSCSSSVSGLFSSSCRASIVGSILNFWVKLSA
mmetsp:Transcript_1614/g.3970  ORF Transcript_1614/g.3970 Transcript_1614/m.3970 type:complete len:236 (-) Transcript_1614:355-1062(-)